MMTAFGLVKEARFYTCDPFHNLHEATFAATDALVATGWISVVGVDCYPQDAVVASGVPVEGICWYPWLDQPAWGRPGTRTHWPCGYRGQADMAEAA